MKKGKVVPLSAPSPGAAEENEDSSENLFIPEQYDDAEEEAERKRLADEIFRKRKLTTRLRDEVSFVDAANKSLAFQLEEKRIKSASIWFYVLVIPTVACTLGAWTKGAYVLTAANWVAFLLVWRSLYTRHNALWFVVSASIVAYTIKF
jgi:hypothetical protein